MKVQIRDAKALSTLSIVSLRSYLASKEWRNEGAWGDRPALIYMKEHAGRSWDILVPTRDTVADYPERMADAVAALAAVEDRSQLDIFNALKAATSDVIRLRSINGIAQEPISLRRNADLLEGTYGMVAAAARSAENSRAVYHGKHSSEVQAYLENVRPLPEYVEGYSLTLCSQVPASNGNKQNSRRNGHHEPFARRATNKLAQALERADTAISKSADSVAIDLSLFKNAVDYGVSANLCASVAKIVKKGKGVVIGIQWAAARPANVPNSNFRFTEDSADILNDAAKFFRDTAPSYDEQLIAQVDSLDRGMHRFDGQAHLLPRQDSQYARKRIKVKFAQPDHDMVIYAFHRNREISLSGDMHKVGNGYELRNPRNLSITEQEAQPE